MIFASLQGPFPKTFPLLPDLVILEMDHNRFRCAPAPHLPVPLASVLRTVFECIVVQRNSGAATGGTQHIQRSVHTCSLHSTRQCGQHFKLAP